LLRTKSQKDFFTGFLAWRSMILYTLRMRKTVIAIAFLLLGACTQTPEPLAGSEKDYPRLTIDGFSVDAKTINVQREDVYIFDYATEEETNSDLQKLSDDGRSMGQMALAWHQEPAVHVFATGRQIAVYVGSTVAVLDELLKEGGEQIVGDVLPKGVTMPSIASSAQSSSM
jgi:hypothetical protein